MKSKLIVILCATAALAGCDQGQDQMNEPSGAERPSYESPDRSTNAPSTSTNQSGATNDANSAGTSRTP